MSKVSLAGGRGGEWSVWISREVAMWICRQKLLPSPKAAAPEPTALPIA